MAITLPASNSLPWLLIPSPLLPTDWGASVLGVIFWPHVYVINEHLLLLTYLGSKSFNAQNHFLKYSRMQARDLLLFSLPHSISMLILISFSPPSFCATSSPHSQGVIYFFLGEERIKVWIQLVHFLFTPQYKSFLHYTGLNWTMDIFLNGYTTLKM